MPKPKTTMLPVALLGAGILIAFAYYERTENAYRLPAFAFYLAAAAICLFPAISALVRHKFSCGGIRKLGT